jgi:hypothetical protein
MSAAAVLPIIQARAEFVPVLRRVQAAAAEPSSSGPSPRPQLAFYRKYTEALLRRYLRMSLEVGRVPSLLGREMFRAKVSSYRMESFEDVVIFCHDVERCIQRLTDNEQFMIGQIALKEYNVLETAEMLGTCRQTIIRQYTRALDRLTAIFLEVEILNPSKCCQAPKTVENSPTSCN